MTRAGDDQSPAPFGRIAIIGAGAWGTALAMAAVRAGRSAILWAREAAVIESVARDRTNPFMAGVTLPTEITVTGSLEEALAGADLVLLTTPSQHLRAMAVQCESLLMADIPVAICAKGVEADSGLLMSEVIAQAMPGRPQAVISGPTFAAEVARDLPTAVTVAAAGTFDSHHLAARIAVTFATTRFRPYLADDVVGVEIGGAVKNVIAIACGIAQGRALGSNARATLITRGLAELTRLAVALGARADTLSGLAGVGDLVLTCSSEQSRNFSYGKALGEGLNPRLDAGGPVVEGAVNAASVVALAARLGVDMPICEAVDAVLRGASLDRVMMGLMTSGLRPEPLAAEDQMRIPHPAARDR